MTFELDLTDWDIHADLGIITRDEYMLNMRRETIRILQALTFPPRPCPSRWLS